MMRPPIAAWIAILNSCRGIRSFSLPQIARPRRTSSQQRLDGVWLIAWGFFQKIFVADNLAPLASRVFAPDANPTGVNVLLGTYAFAFQIFCLFDELSLFC